MQWKDEQLKDWLHNTGRTAALALLLLAAIAATAAERSSPWSWSTEKIDSSGIYPSMKIDTHDDIHLIYVTVGSPGRLTYAYRPSDTKKWFKFPITYGRATTALALDSKGHPNVVFELGDGQLWFTSFNGETWQPPSQISPGFGKIEYSCTIALDGANRPHLFWYQITHGGSDYYHLRHAELSNGSWQASTLDDARETGKWHSAISGPDGQIYVVYSAFPDAQLKLAHFDGKEWNYEVVDSRPPSQTKNIHPIFGGSIALDKTGMPMISYEDENRIKFAHKVNGKWAIEEVDPILPFATREKWWELNTSIAVDNAGMIHIVYTDGGAVKHAYQDNGKWRVETLVGSGADSSRFPELAAGHDGNLYLVYRDPDDGALMLATGRPLEAAPSAGTTESASGSPDTALANSATADFAGLASTKRDLLEDYLKSADQGSTAALKFLGTSYLTGKDIPKDPARAAQWYRKAAEEGDAGAQTMLAWLYLNGIGVPQDNGEALRWVRLATERNFAAAQSILGWMNANGKGVSQSDEEAAKWYKLAAEQGNTSGEILLAAAYLRGVGVPRDNAQAVTWVRKAAEQGLAVAQTALGYLYQDGEGVAKDDTEAFHWFQKAAAQNFAPAERSFGSALLHGRGVKKNLPEGVVRVRKAATQGNAEAMAQLGDLYRLGQGVKHDMVKAKELYCASAEGGSPEGMNNCSHMILDAATSGSDAIESVKWVELALSRTPPGNFHDNLKETLNYLKAKLTPEQFVEGERRASNFKPHTVLVPSSVIGSKAGGK